ncbi:hypothetical protein COLO4_26205 [Corchorus olitorius]|uniref:Secreted protein n=1 Tax=Corchorus olitorius TaxID=93759 RepID=A0A1R3HY82_9ROSI|nr:hypothetical protein COLO4_26205 [Corchorus olitorius]
MGVRGSHFVPFLASVLMLRSAAAAAEAAAAAGPEGEKKPLATVQFINAIPKNERSQSELGAIPLTVSPARRVLMQGRFLNGGLKKKPLISVQPHGARTGSLHPLRVFSLAKMGVTTEFSGCSRRMGCFIVGITLPGSNRLTGRLSEILFFLLFDFLVNFD